MLVNAVPSGASMLKRTRGMSGEAWREKEKEKTRTAIRITTKALGRTSRQVVDLARSVEGGSDLGSPASGAGDPSGTVSSAAMKRYPRRAIVSINWGLSAESPSASLRRLMAALMP